jgi:hypothetical protein
MPNYANSKIYKLVSFNLPELPYYGSTVQTLCKRKGEHVSDFKKFGFNVGGCTSRIVIAAGDYEIIWVEDFPCERKDQLKARERHYVENHVCVNKNVPGRTKEEWKQANPTYQKEYYKANEAHVKAYQKEWQQANPMYKKEYYKKNATAYAEKYRVNGAVQRARESERIQCTVCDCMTSRGNIAKHQRTAKCKRAGLLISGAVCCTQTDTVSN